MVPDPLASSKPPRPALGWFVALFVALMASIMVYPEMRSLGVPLIVIQFLTRTTAVCALLAAAPPRTWLLTALAVLVVSTISNATQTSQSARLITSLVDVAVLLCIIARIVRFVFQGGVSVNTIFAGVCAYLLIGYLFGMVFWLLSSVQGHGVLVNAEGKYAAQDETVYFSYIALTTTGFGDVRPVSPLARSLSIVEALTGQLYLVLLLGRLVGLHVSQSERRTPPSTSDDRTN